VARYGGDEFVILMPETSPEQARQIAGKLRAWISEERMLRDRNVTASFGIASFPAHGSTPEELIQAADLAMYASKRSGGNMVSDLDSRQIAESGAAENRTF
jgi:diguanylate cyclase (GGDEF)-like protein